MNRLAMCWNCILYGRKEALYSIRALAVLSFCALIGLIAAQQFHRGGLAGFFAGMAVALSGILVFQVFYLGSAEYKRDCDASESIELHLSR